MRTVSYKSVMYGIARLAGLSPDTSDLSQETADTIGEFISRRVREGWEDAWWPELMLCEERYYRAAWDDGTAYVVDDEVWHADTGLYWRCLVAHTDEEPVDGSTYWEEATDLDRYVPYELGDLEPLGEVKLVSKTSPRASSAPYKLAFEPSELGIQVDIEAGDSVWVTFRKRPATFGSTPWAVGTAYAIGDVVYYATTGECYRATQAHTGQTPTTAAYWELMDLPYVIAEFVKMAGYADWLRNDGQTEKAVAESDRAGEELARAEDVALSAQGATNRARVRVA